MPRALTQADAVDLHHMLATVSVKGTGSLYASANMYMKHEKTAEGSTGNESDMLVSTCYLSFCMGASSWKLNQRQPVIHGVMTVCRSV